MMAERAAGDAPTASAAAAGDARRLRVGVLDSGVGGLSVLREIIALLPAVETLYAGDTARCPYGGRPASEVAAFCGELTRGLLASGCDLVVVACNTATALAVDALRAAHPAVPIVGMEPAIKPAALHSRTGVVGVLATAGTLRGGRFRRTKERFAGATRVIEVVGAGLVELVERGAADTPEADALLRPLLAPVLEAGADKLVLGCTHFPFLREAIRRVAGDALELVDSGAAVARRVRDLLPATPASSATGSITGSATGNAPPARLFFATGDGGTLSRLASRLLTGAPVQLLPALPAL
ncbi:MAG: glutamate racemase [Puniceicoccales bacterium]|jgi:glutamate racemase|nr:glutamate racemase [Puniceicoccales bacterium]